jgi:hypothetical protein
MNDASTNAGEAQPHQTSLALLIQTLFRSFAGLDRYDLPNAPLDARWRKVLGLSESANLYLPLSQVERALDRLDNQVDALPPKLDRTKVRSREGLSGLRASIQPVTLGRDWSSVAQFVTPERLDRLDMLADILQEFAPEALPADGVIPDLLTKLDAIGEAIDAAPFPAHVRAALQGRLEALRWAAVNWHLIGADGVADAAGALAAAVSFARHHIPETDEEGKTSVERLFRFTIDAMDWIGRWMVVRDVCQGGAALLQSPGIAGLLGIGGN